MSPSLHDARRLLQERFGYPDFRPGQAELIEAALCGRDALGVLPTGGGKSLCYQIPALAHGLTLVLSPLVSLMQDQARRAEEAGIPVGVLNSTTEPDARRRILDLSVRGELRLLFVAPERLEQPAFLDRLRCMPIRLVAVDEAHAISEWGHDFRPAYRRIGRIRNVVRASVLALTATATPRTREDIVTVLGLENAVRVVQSFDRPNLRWSVVSPAGDTAHETAIVRRVRCAPGPALVYASTRKRTERIRRTLARAGIPAAVYHAGLGSEDRRSVQNDFLENRVRVVVATCAFGMGVDKPDVRLVVHDQLPGTLESYYQEAGRAGRDGEPAECVALRRRGDERLARLFIDGSRPRPRQLGTAYRRLIGRARHGGVRRTTLGELTRTLNARGPRQARDLLAALQRLGSVETGDQTTLADVDALPETELAFSMLGSPDLDQARRLRRAACRSLTAVRRYARARLCRRRAILRYFGESAPYRCGSCDCCWPGKD